MSNKTALIIIIVGVIVIGVVGGLMFVSLTKDNDVNGLNIEDETQNEGDVDESRQTISAKYVFSDGEHVIAGEIDLPTPCHVVEVDAVVAESFPEQVMLRFTTRSEADVCAQVITPARFVVTFSASEEARVSATLNGEPVRLNLIPAREDENLKGNFDVFIKG